MCTYAYKDVYCSYVYNSETFKIKPVHLYLSIMQPLQYI